MITRFEQLDLNKRYTYADYLTWQFEDMVELIRGKVFKMSPAPSRRHQEVSSSLLKAIFSQPSLGDCQVFHAPFDVRLLLPEPKQTTNKIDTVVQPDICVICDLSKLDDRGCNGAPDWVIEILSPATSQKDLTEKFDIYQYAGVKEYWVVHPSEATVLVYILDADQQYQLLRKTPFTKGELVPVSVLPGLVMDLEVVLS